VAWVFLACGLVYARFVVVEPPPNVVITFSDKGLARLFVELVTFGIGSLGFLLAVVAFARGAGNRAVAFAAAGSATVCVVCVALLM
jgi:hypothetical protein